MTVSYQRHNSENREHVQVDLYRDFHFRTHFHRDLEFFYVLEGEIEVSVPGRTEMACAGQFGLFLSNQIHSFFTPGHSLTLVCPFSEDFVGEFRREMQGREGIRTVFDGSEGLRAYIGECFRDGRTPDRMTLKAALYALCAAYLEQVPTGIKATSEDGAVHRLLKYVDEHYRENITLSSAAHEIGYDEDYLSRQFHRVVGMNFRRFLNMYRVNCACDLLKDSDVRLTEVAFESGFQNARGFNRAFREHTGLSPLEYRKNGNESEMV